MSRCGKAHVSIVNTCYQNAPIQTASSSWAAIAASQYSLVYPGVQSVCSPVLSFSCSLLSTCVTLNDEVRRFSVCHATEARFKTGWYVHDLLPIHRTPTVAHVHRFSTVCSAMINLGTSCVGHTPCFCHFLSWLVLSAQPLYTYL